MTLGCDELSGYHETQDEKQKQNTANTMKQTIKQVRKQRNKDEHTVLENCTSKLKYTLRAKQISRIALQNWRMRSNKQLGLDGLISKNLLQNWNVTTNTLENCTSKLKYTFKQAIRFRWVDLKESVSKLKRAKHVLENCTPKLKYTLRAKKSLRVVLHNWITLSYKPLCLDWLISKNAIENWSVPEKCTWELYFKIEVHVQTSN